MDVAGLSDNDLRKALADYGVDAGPVTATTRSIYRKKLSKVVSSSQENSQRHCVDENYSEVVSSATFDINSSSDQVDFQKVKTESKKKEKSPPEPTINTQSPYRYAQHSFPSDDILRRRPLYTPGGTLRTIPKTSSPLSATVKQFDETDGNKATKSSFPWCRLLLVVLLLCVLLVVLVYYHMEQNQVSKLPIESKA